jgi:hypothetical protein
MGEIVLRQANLRLEIARHVAGRAPIASRIQAAVLAWGKIVG